MLKKAIVTRLAARLQSEITSRHEIAYLHQYEIEEYYDALVDSLYLYTRPSAQRSYSMFVEVALGIGHRIRRKLSLKTDTGAAIRTGAFFLYTFEELGILQLGLTKGKRGHNTYYINLLDDEPLVRLWEDLPRTVTEKTPLLAPAPKWESAWRPDGKKLMRTGSKEALKALTIENNPLVFDSVNKTLSIGWRINKTIRDVAMWAFRFKHDAFKDIWDADKKAQTTKVRETKTILRMAKNYLGIPFYHDVYLDFRGRKYPDTAYLHEQGSDLARGMLLLDKEEPLTQAGYQWLLVSLANLWAGTSHIEGRKTDKIPILERIKWAEANEASFIDYALEPKKAQGWMQADKPWQFLALCMELVALRNYQGEIGDFDDYGYPTRISIYIDGSNNGSQHLVALTRDDITAPYVNLVPQEYPGDLYQYVGEHIWKRLEAITKDTPEDVRQQHEQIINEAKERHHAKRNRSSDPELDAADREWYREHREELKAAAPFFWLRFKDDPQAQRKLCKRGVMTLPYGGTRYGLGQQIIDDSSKHGYEDLTYMARSWGAFLGQTIYDDCRTSLARPMRLLGVFEAQGKMAELREEFLSWTVPQTNLKVVQHYIEGTVKKLWVQYGPPKGVRKATGHFANTLQIHVAFIEDPKPSKGKQAAGTSPNCIHSLDAAHLTMVVAACEFPVITIHDSFGCSPRFMPELFKEVRTQFHKLYKTNPLATLLFEMGAKSPLVDYGQLAIELIEESNYAFL